MSDRPPASLTRMIDAHARLNEFFALHQEALIDLDLPMARRHLDDHALAIGLHIREEEEVLLPVFARRAGRIAGGTTEIFEAEHRHILALVEDLRREVGTIRLDDPALRRRVIALFDREALYKHLLDHHDRRERNVLYPVLDRVTSAEEREQMLAGCGMIRSSAS